MAKARGRAQHQRLQEKWQRQIENQAQRDAKTADAAARKANREAQAEYVAARAAEAERDTAELKEWAADLHSLLADGLGRSSRIDLVERRVQASVPPLDLGGVHLGVLQPPIWEEFAPPPTRRLGQGFWRREAIRRPARCGAA